LTLNAGQSATIQGNLIGTNAAGTAAVGNGSTGVRVVGGAGTPTTIGGTAAGARNVISGNGEGVGIGAGSGAVVAGNYIGTDAAGTGDVGNAGYGVSVTSSGNTIGG